MRTVDLGFFPDLGSSQLRSIARVQLVLYWNSLLLQHPHRHQFLTVIAQQVLDERTNCDMLCKPCDVETKDTCD